MYVKYLAIIVLLFSFLNVAFSQSKKELELKKKKIQRDIARTKNLLDENNNDKKESLNKLVKLNKKIDGHKQVISAINSEINLINNDITTKSTEVKQLLNNLAELKKEYARLMQFAQKNNTAYDKFLFVFGAEDFTRAYNRMKYLNEFTAYRKVQGIKIIQQQKLLKSKVDEMQLIKSDKVGLVGEQQQEVKQLGSAKKAQEVSLVKLSQKEKELKQQLQKKQEDSQRLQQAIQKIIEQEIRKARELAEKEEARKAAEYAAREKIRKEKEKRDKAAGKKVISVPEKEPVATKKLGGLILTPDAQLLSNSFEANRGRLPWPVTEGVITSSYGVHAHPVLKNVQTKNDGVNIAAKRGASVRAIFDGEVTGVVSIPNSGKAVIVRHGQYLSVYTNLGDVSVNKGDKIKTKQNIGTLLVDNDNKSELQLQIWKGSNTQDPVNWIDN